MGKEEKKIGESVRESLEKAKNKLEGEAPESLEGAEIEAPEPEPELQDETTEPGEEQISEPDQNVEISETDTLPEETSNTELEAEGESIKPPNSWSAESKSLWNKLPREVQQEALRREKETQAELTRTKQSVSRFMDGYGPVAQILSPYENELRMRGLSPAYMVQEMIKDKTFEDTDPQGYILQKMQQYGFRPEQFIQQQTQNIPPELQGVLAPLQRELAQVRSVRQQMEMQEANRRMAEQNARNNEIASAMEDFGSKNSDNPVIQDPEFIQELVEQAAYITERQPNKPASERLSLAYERALKLTKKGQQYLEQQSKAKQMQVQKAKIAQAKAAGSSISGSVADTIAEPKIGKTVRDAVKAAARKQQGGTR